MQASDLKWYHFWAEADRPVGSWTLGLLFAPWAPLLITRVSETLLRWDREQKKIQYFYIVVVE